MRQLKNWLAAEPVAPEKLQIAALCYKNTSEGLVVLLVTSRGTGRWILPKGWPEEKASSWKVAKQEAFEEAGIIGKAAHEPLGTFNSYKDMSDGTRISTVVTVYPVKVRGQKNTFPECEERQRQWLPIEDAARECGDAGLAAFLLNPGLRSALR